MYNSIFLSSFLLKSLIIRGNLLTTLSIGIIRTFITDSCKFVVTLSRYSICSLKLWLMLSEPSSLLAETRPFFAIISSLTRFISTSSFSISTRTVCPTGFALLLAVCCFAPAGFFEPLASFLSFDGSAFEACLAFSSVFSSFGSSSVFSSGKAFVISSPSASLISDTFLIILMISSKLSSVKITI